MGCESQAGTLKQRVREAYGASYTHLDTRISHALKKTWDPDNVLRLNQNIAPQTRL